MNQNNSNIVAETPVRNENYIEGETMNQNYSFAVAETPDHENKNSQGNYCPIEICMTENPVKCSENISFARMPLSDDEYNFIREIHCIVNSVSDKHAEGHYMVTLICGHLKKTELDSDFIYDGEISDSFPNGIGIMKFVNGKSDNLSKMGLPEGIGEGWNYSGSFVCGIPHGKGTWSGPNGEFISGIFQSGMITKGEISYTSGNAIVFRQSGDFFHGPLIGESCDPLLYHSGQLGPDVFFHGKCEYANGLSAYGLWKNNKFVTGQVCFPDGRWYIGQWSHESGQDMAGKELHGQPHGFGMLYLPDGSILAGTWANGRLVETTPPKEYISHDNYFNEENPEYVVMANVIVTDADGFEVEKGQPVLRDVKDIPSESELDQYAIRVKTPGVPADFTYHIDVGVYELNTFWGTAGFENSTPLRIFNKKYTL